MTTEHHPAAIIEVDPVVPMIRITRDFSATPAQLMAAHLDPELFVRWVGPDGMVIRTVTRDAWLASGMESGVNDGYAELDRLLTEN